MLMVRATRSDPSILEFSDFRAYLLAYAQKAKSRNPRWSMAAWASKLGLRDTSSVTKILRGQRNPGDSVIKKFERYFAFSEPESLHFRDLIGLQKAKHDPRLREILWERVSKRSGLKPVRILDDRTFSVISKWQCFAIRAMTRFDSFVEDPKWISGKLRFKSTATETLRAIEALLSVGLLARDRSGRLRIAQGQVHTTSDTASEAIKLYHEQMLENARTAVRKIDVLDREFGSSTFVMPVSRLPKAKELIRSFKSEFEALVGESHSPGEDSEVFQFQIQFFPLTQLRRSNES